MKPMYYLGSFPPPYGGVTIKNEMMYSVLSEYVDVIRVGNESKIDLVLGILKGKMVGKGFIIGAGSDKSLVALSKLLSRVAQKKMRNSIVFAMGGTLPIKIEKDRKDVSLFRHYKHIYVETQSMADRMYQAGLTNVSCLPNCRKRPQNPVVNQLNTGRLRCLFFSLVSREKGADKVLQVAERLPEIHFDLYGHISEDYKEEFLNSTKASANVRYKGVFTGKGDEVYELISRYDVLLFPTSWVHEGVPGVLVEAKIAGVPAIVSDINYNSELIDDGIDGLVLSETTSDALRKAIERLDEDRELLKAMQIGARKSSESFIIDKYISNIVKMVNS